MQPFRIQPQAPASVYKTYELAAPRATHFRPGTCAEVSCPHHERGWRTIVDESSDLGQRQAGYIRHRAGRAFREHRDEAGRTVFDFPPGQRCFAAANHLVPLEREPLYLVRGGDWRGNPLRVPTLRHADATDWVDDFGEHQQRVADHINRG